MSETTNAPEKKSTITPADFHMPPNSYWPIILAFGFVLVLTGLAVSWPISIAGILITFVATIGWVIEPV